MLILKIHYEMLTQTDPTEDGSIVQGTTDIADHFIEADSISAHDWITDDGQMAAWEPGAFEDMRSRKLLADGKTEVRSGRLIQVSQAGKSQWYLATRAWIMGSDGRTIERLA